MFFLTKITPNFGFILRDRFLLVMILYHCSLINLTNILRSVLGGWDTSVNTGGKNLSIEVNVY